MSYSTKGSSRSVLPLYTSGYVIGTKREGPSAYMLLTNDVVFGGFSPNFKLGDQGVLLVTQDAFGGHAIDWAGKLIFNGSSTINLGPSSRTIIDAILVSGGVWIGTIRGSTGTGGGGGGGGGTADNGIPAGGAPGTVLRKVTPADYDVSWHQLTPEDVGLFNIDDTADLDKPISTLTQEALDLKAPLLSPVFEGKPVFPSSNSGSAGVQFTPGFAPVAPLDGDWWLTTNGYYSHVNGTTFQIGPRVTVAIQDFQMSCSDLDTPLIDDTFSGYLRVTRSGTFIEVRASVVTPSTAGDIVINLKVNGSTVLSTPLTIPQGSRTSVGAPVPAVISNGVLVSDDEVSVEIVMPGVGATGLIVSIIYESPAVPAAGVQGSVQFNTGTNVDGTNDFIYDALSKTLSVQNLQVNNSLTGIPFLLNPMTDLGDLIVGGTSGTPIRLAPATDGMFLGTVSNVPQWVAMDKVAIGLGSVDNTADIDKNVLSATKWTTPRNMVLSGALSGITTFDGSNDIVLITSSKAAQMVGFATAITIDASLTDRWEIGVLSADTVLTVTKMSSGQTLRIRFKQDGVGGHTVNLPSGTAYSGTLGVDPNEVSYLTLVRTTTDNRLEGIWDAMASVVP
jgi:hypothetical protein